MAENEGPKRSVPWAAVVLAILTVYAGGYFVVLEGPSNNPLDPDFFFYRRSINWRTCQYQGIWRLYVPAVWLEANLRGETVDLYLITQDGPNHTTRTQVYSAQP